MNVSPMFTTVFNSFFYATLLKDNILHGEFEPSQKEIYKVLLHVSLGPILLLTISAMTISSF